MQTIFHVNRVIIVFWCAKKHQSTYTRHIANFAACKNTHAHFHSPVIIPECVCVCVYGKGEQNNLFCYPLPSCVCIWCKHERKCIKIVIVLAKRSSLWKSHRRKECYHASKQASEHYYAEETKLFLLIVTFWLENWEICYRVTHTHTQTNEFSTSIINT